jgi:predicted Zn-dependent peptidase
MFQTQQIRQNFNFHTKHSTQFKDNTFVFRFLFPMTQHNINCAQVYNELLDDRSINAPTKQAMLRWMDELYDASFGSYITTYGQSFVLSVVFKGIEGSIVNDSEQNQRFLSWMMMILEGVLVNKETLKEAKTNVLQNVKREQEQHVKYALALSAERYENTSYALKVDGDETVIKISLDDIHNFTELLKQVACDVYHIGQFDDSIILEELKKSFLLQDKLSSPTFTMLKSKPLPRHSVQKFSPQTVLVKTYATNVDYQDPRYLAYRVAAIAFGSLPTSLLFTNVREKNSLCYFIHASVIAFDGVMNVITGIESDKVDIVSAMIDEQFVAMKDIDDSLIEQAKQMMIHSLVSSDDDVMSMINLHYSSRLKGEEFNIEMITKKINELKREQILEAIQSSECIGEFVLLGENNV